VASGSGSVFAAPSFEGQDRTRGALALAQPAPQAAPQSVPQPVPQRAPQAAIQPRPQAVVHPEFAVPAVIPAPPPPPAPKPIVDPPAVRLERPANLDTWRAIVNRVRAVRAPLASVLEHAVPLEVTAERVLLGFESTSFLGAQASEPEAMDLLRREARAHFGADTVVALDLSLRVAGTATAVTMAAIDAEERKDALAKARGAVEQHPLVQKAIALFGAELREVRLPGGEE
jgi:hypothetical protein